VKSKLFCNSFQEKFKGIKKSQVMSSKTILVSKFRCPSPGGEKRNSMLLRGGETVEIMPFPWIDGLMASRRKPCVPVQTDGLVLHGTRFFWLAAPATACPTKKPIFGRLWDTLPILEDP
jgi:hypothetical protein